jgi:hypothetical protein
MVQERVLRALVESGKPFAMLLPISVLHVGFVREILDTDEVRDEGMGWGSGMRVLDEEWDEE